MRDLLDRVSFVEPSISGLQVILGIVFLPHELAHYYAMQPWCEKPRLEFFVKSSARTRVHVPTPAKVTGRFKPATPLWAIRFVTVAPTLSIGFLAILLGFFVDLSFYTAEFWISWPLLSLWAAPSNEDMNAWYRAHSVQESGNFGDQDGSIGKKAVISSWIVSIGISTILFILLLV